MLDHPGSVSISANGRSVKTPPSAAPTLTIRWSSRSSATVSLSISGFHTSLPKVIPAGNHIAAAVSSMTVEPPTGTEPSDAIKPNMMVCTRLRRGT